MDLQPLEHLALHRAANCHNFRQEVSETMALLRALEQVRGDLKARFSLKSTMKHDEIPSKRLGNSLKRSFEQL